MIFAAAVFLKEFIWLLAEGDSMVLRGLPGVLIIPV